MFEVYTTDTLCRNAYAGPSAWFCYHWNGAVTPGEEATNWQGDCRACAVATTSGELVSFRDNVEEK